MARPIKDSIEYFPHFINAGRTVFILENKYGNDGYAFWFKLLEILGASDKHYYDCSDKNNWEYFLAKTRCSNKMALEIINTLISLGQIDAELWENKILWCQGLVDNLSGLYARRKIGVPQKPTIDGRTTPSSIIIKNKKAKQKTEPVEEEDNTIYEELDSEIEELKNSPIWLENIQMLHNLSKEEILKRLDEFKQHCIAEGKRIHRGDADTKRHFNNWIRKVKSYDTDRTNSQAKRRANILSPTEEKKYTDTF